jgi:hypothetical protein
MPTAAPLGLKPCFNPVIRLSLALIANCMVHNPEFVASGEAPGHLQAVVVT